MDVWVGEKEKKEGRRGGEEWKKRGKGRGIKCKKRGMKLVGGRNVEWGGS